MEMGVGSTRTEVAAATFLSASVVSLPAFRQVAYLCPLYSGAEYWPMRNRSELRGRSRLRYPIAS